VNIEAKMSEGSSPPDATTSRAPGADIPLGQGVTVPPSGVEIAPGVIVPASALRWQYARSSGPGGQNVNKVNTKAELWVAVGSIVGLTERAAGRLRSMAGKRLTSADEIHIAADSERSQEQNRDAAFDRLRALVAAAVYEPKPRRKSKPSKAAKQRRLDQKHRRGDVKSHRRAGGKWD
jgi:ribosome-associated protein